MLTETHDGIVYQVALDPGEVDRRVARLVAGLWSLFLRTRGQDGEMMTPEAAEVAIRGCSGPGAANLPGSPGVLDG